LFLPLTPQEAYYWNYSRHPALSYFDHPPLTAYMIKLTTIFGVSDFSIHLAAIILSVPLCLAVYRLAETLFDSTVAFWSLVAINLTFIYALGSLIITPDVPMLLFWVLLMIACHRAARDGGYIWWFLMGIFAGAGFLAKYTMVFAFLGAFIFLITSRKRAGLFLTGRPYLAMLAAFIVILPVFYWNYQNGWASFLFQSSRRVGEMSEFRADFFFGFLATVIGIYGIVPIPLLFAGAVDSVKRAIGDKDRAHALLLSFSLPLVAFLLPVATRSWVKMNWTAPAFIALFIAGVAYWRRYSGSITRVRFWGRFSVTFLAVTFLAAHIVFVLPGLYYGRGDYSVGWEELATRVDSVRKGLPEPYFVCGYEYKTASLLAYHLDGRPETVSNNIVGRSGLQYDFWSDPDTLLGYNAVFVYDSRNAYKTPEKLATLFESVSPPEILTVKKGGKKITDFHIFRCFEYRGLNEGE
jgi:4-amino-4-deoxy-L-arabinose transferase-like glycosyltransferase